MQCDLFPFSCTTDSNKKALFSRKPQNEKAATGDGKMREIILKLALYIRQLELATHGEDDKK